MEEQNKSHFWRFAAGFALLMALGLGIYYAIGWYEWRGVQNEAAANDRALQDMKELEAQYENDTYGGTTPEATLALFIDALKKGFYSIDIHLWKRKNSASAHVFCILSNRCFISE